MSSVFKWSQLRLAKKAAHAKDERTKNGVVLCTAGYDHTIRFWHATTGQGTRTLQYADSQVNALEITPDKQYLAVAGNPHVRLYEVNTALPSPIMSFDGHTNNVTAIGFQKDRKWMFTGSEDGTVKIWDIRAPGFQRNYQVKAPVNTVALHPNQAELVSGDADGLIRVWDLTANKSLYRTIPDSKGKCAVRSIAIASDASTIVMANSRGTFYVWKWPQGDNFSKHSLWKVDAHNAYILKCALSSDLKYLATCSSDKTVKLWSVDHNFRFVKKLSGHQRWVWDCAFSEDSQYLMTDKTARLWNIAAAQAILEYKGHHKAITAMAFNDTVVA